MLRIGTCSWKYASWKGIVYSGKTGINYLKEYAAKYNTVEVDQWFWSLFEKEVVLPDPGIVEEYRNSVTDDFRFTIKLPNSLSLTHYYNKNRQQTLLKNPYFLSADLFYEFLDSIKCLDGTIGCLILQFEYLNKEKMSSLSEFQERLGEFFDEVKGSSPPVAVEIRNPNYLSERYFRFLADQGIAHVFLQGYFMPPVPGLFSRYRKYIKGPAVIRLHGPDRSGIEQMSGKVWNRILINRDDELQDIAEMVKVLSAEETDIYLNVNNHYEGSAPLTIDKIVKFI